MTTIPSPHTDDHEDRVRATGAVLVSAGVLVAFLVGASLAVSQVVEMVTWALAGN
jgi:hypothetical protein